MVSHDFFLIDVIYLGYMYIRFLVNCQEIWFWSWGFYNGCFYSLFGKSKLNAIFVSWVRSVILFVVFKNVVYWLWLFHFIILVTKLISSDYRQLHLKLRLVILDIHQRIFNLQIHSLSSFLFFFGPHRLLIFCNIFIFLPSLWYGLRIFIPVCFFQFP